MTAALLEVNDLTQVDDAARTCVLNVELSAEQVGVLQEEADRRGVTLEAYVRCAAFTTAAVENAGGRPLHHGAA